MVEAFERAGFVLMGRTNTPELGPITVTENNRYGITRNPWDLSYSPGGSSGGAAAAVASGMAPAAHGNDGGGSIRIPASCCGLVGLKPSRGRVPARVNPWEGAAVEGALTRTVADAAGVLDVICGPDPLCWYNAPAPDRPFAEEVGRSGVPRRLRVGVLEKVPLGLPGDPGAFEGMHTAARLLQDLGHQVEPADIELVDEAHMPAFLNCVNSGYASQQVEDWEKVEPHNLAGYQAALGVNSIDYVVSVHALQLMTRVLVSHWGRDFDLLLTPTMAIEPPLAGSVLEAAHAEAGPPLAVVQMVAFTIAFNVSGQPAISLPLHWSQGGLPVGAQ
ncbi:MAG: amidase, partial [Acidimicrobiales bacterium]